MWRQAGLIVPLVLVLGVEALALGVGGVAGFALLGLAVVLLIAVIARLNLDRAGLVCTYGAALFIPLYGVGGHLRPGDLLLPVALVLFLFTQAARPWPHIPVWVWVLTLGIVVVAVLHEVAPTDAAYLGARTVVDAAGRLGPEPQTNLGVAFRFVFSVPMIPLVCALAAQRSSAAPRRIAVAFTLGAALSGLVAFLHAHGLAAVTTALGASSEGTRQGGLSGHPNFLGAATALALPFALRMAVAGRLRVRVLGCMAAPCIALGAYETGSRGGVAALLLGTVAYLASEPRVRRYLPHVGLAISAFAVLCFVILPSWGAAVLRATRLSSTATGAKGSDVVRQLVAEQGLRDFSYSPFDGVGLQVSAEAHNAYLQALAAGGLILFVTYIVFVAGALWTSAAALRRYRLAIPLIASVAAAALYNGLENTLTYRFVYVPAGIAAALASLRAARDRPAEPDAATPSELDALHELSTSIPHR